MDATIKRSDGFIEVTGGSVVVLTPEGTPAGKPVTIGPDPCIVGRGEHCHLVVRDPAMSTVHCELTATNKGVLVKDLATTNGTYVNQVRLEKAGYLIFTARLRCGETWLEVRISGPEQVPVSTSGTFGRLIGRSAAMRRVFAKLASVVGYDVNVLVTGETGTGKELVAEAIHQASHRKSGGFVVVDCTAINASLAESKLFGHEKGAFTGAVARVASPFVDANRGTIFFDELGELPWEIQPKLLRALEAREVQAVGATRFQPVDVRIVAATRRDLHAEMNAKRFREDLYFRFAQIVVEIPPLRDRTEDIPDLVARFFADLGDPGAMSRVDTPTMARLQRHDWPGNVRELRNVIRVAHAQAGGVGGAAPIDVVELLSTSTSGGTRIPMPDHLSTSLSYDVGLEAFEREYFAALSKSGGGNISEMARLSGLSRPMLRGRIDRYGLQTSPK